MSIPLPHTPLIEHFKLRLVPDQSPANLSTIGHRQRLFENLRMLPHAPGVQMQAIPEDAIPEESGDEDEEDPDKRISSKTQTSGAFASLLHRPLSKLPSC